MQSSVDDSIVDHSIPFGDAVSPEERMSVLGIQISILTMAGAVARIMSRAARPGAAFVFVREIASLSVCSDNRFLRVLHREAFLVVPDGMPIVWIGWLRGHGKRIARVAGADLLEQVCQASLKTGQSHYFYGGADGVAKQLVEQLLRKFPGLNVAGMYSPPFRDISPDFEPYGLVLDEIQKINEAAPDFIWVGISSPKQEIFMAKAARHLNGGVLIGVGAAFNFASGAIPRAPKWMRDIGLEWAYRFYKEPRRLWKRYLLLAPRFAFRFVARSISKRIPFLDMRSANY